MFSVMLWALILVAALAALIKGADWFTEGVESLGIRAGVPPFIIGVTVVSIGTSLPELASSVAAVIAGSSDIVVANVVGSNIANTLFVLGLGALISGGITLTWPLEKSDLPILFGATFLLVLTVVDGRFGWPEALVMLLAFGVYLYYSLRSHRLAKGKSKLNGPLTGAALLGGLTLVIAGSKYLIEAVIAISQLAGISTAALGASVIAFGTSVPEVVVTAVAAVKGKRDIAIGNIIGSNIFNILFIMGVAGLVGQLTIDASILTFAVPMLVASTFILWFVTRDKNVSVWEAAVLILLYAVFIVKLFV